MVGKIITVVHPLSNPTFFSFNLMVFRKKSLSYLVFHISLSLICGDSKLLCVWNFLGKPIPQFLSSFLFGPLRQD